MFAETTLKSQGCFFHRLGRFFVIESSAFTQDRLGTYMLSTGDTTSRLTRIVQNYCSGRAHQRIIKNTDLCGKVM